MTKQAPFFIQSLIALTVRCARAARLSASRPTRLLDSKHIPDLSRICPDISSGFITAAPGRWFHTSC